MNLDKDFWKDRYKESETRWDIGEISEPLAAYINQLNNNKLVILVPGAGNAYEVEYLYKNGFKHVFLLDWAEEPIEDFKKRNPGFPEEQLICDDFFDHKGKYDLILEQTFFCAISKSRRLDYVNHCDELLKKGGKLVGLLFNKPMSDPEPPIGGSKEEYLELFKHKFDVKVMEDCYNSIKPRMGNELFVILEKK